MPTQSVITNQVINWSYGHPKVRLRLPVRISYRDDDEFYIKQDSVTTLPELFLNLGEKYTAMELYFFYNNCQRIVKKRAHQHSSKDRRDAAWLRWRETGRWGHK